MRLVPTAVQELFQVLLVKVSSPNPMTCSSRNRTAQHGLRRELVRDLQSRAQIDMAGRHPTGLATGRMKRHVLEDVVLHANGGTSWPTRQHQVDLRRPECPQRERWAPARRTRQYPSMLMTLRLRRGSYVSLYSHYIL